MRTLYNLLQKKTGKENYWQLDRQYRHLTPNFGLWSVYWCATDGKTHESGRPANSSQHYNSASWNVRSWPPFANDKDSLEDTNIIHGEYLQIMQGTGITLWDNQSYPHTPGQCLKRNHLCCLRLSLHIKLCYIYPDPSQCEIIWASSKERRHS